MPHASSKKSLLFVQFWAARGFCKRVLNSRICQHCHVKTSTVTLTFYYFFIIFLTCYISAPSCNYNLCQVLLLWNHLNECLQSNVDTAKLQTITAVCSFIKMLIYMNKTLSSFHYKVQVTVQTRQSLKKKTRNHLNVTFPLPSSMLKLPNAR